MGNLWCSECELWEGDVTVFDKDSRDWYTAVLLFSLLNFQTFDYEHGVNKGEHSKSKILQSSNTEVKSKIRFSKFNC